MSDPLRKNFSDKLSEKVTPDSQKSTLEKGKEFVTDAADKVGKEVQPQQDKSVSQKAADVGSDAKKDVGNANSSILEQGKEQLASLQNNLGESAKTALDTAGQYINQASEYLQGTGSNASGSSAAK